MRDDTEISYVHDESDDACPERVRQGGRVEGQKLRMSIMYGYLSYSKPELRLITEAKTMKTKGYAASSLRLPVVHSVPLSENTHQRL